MPVAFALLSLCDRRPLVVVPSDGFSQGYATAAMQQFAMLAASFDAAERSEQELCLPTGTLVRYKMMPGGAIIGAVLCDSWENPYEIQDALADLEMVRLVLLFLFYSHEI